MMDCLADGLPGIDLFLEMDHPASPAFLFLRGCEKMILMASKYLFLAYNEIPTTACIQGIQKGGRMQLEAKRGAPWPLKGFFHSL
ncbi:MAG TPA: hypothetical protein VNQ90_03390 [Chthoniobacteraceae bacterium]|nr:hypothetical protein [Chthoniobacteraceae bacterium]